MARFLVIVESPSKAKTIKKYLGKDYLVTSSSGHIRDLAKGKFMSFRDLTAQFDSEHQNRNKYIDSMGIDPYERWNAKYTVSPGKESVVKQLQTLVKDVELIYLATDMDREGEAIAWHIAQVLKKPEEIFLRVVFSEITKSAVQEAFKEPRSLNLNLVNAHLARRYLDRIVGFNLSPLLWIKVAKKLSAGRVQSVAMRLVVEREKEIREFNIEEYWELYAHLRRAEEPVSNSTVAHYRFQVTHHNNQPLARTVKNQGNAEELEADLDQEKFVVVKHEKSPSESRPNAPFTTSTLQQAASSKLKLSVRKTMSVAQQLYEDGHITYMRTDSTNLAASAVQEVRSFITRSFGDKYLSQSPRVYKTKVQSAQEAHEAIRPTNLGFDLATLKNSDQRKLYELIKNRFVACQMSSAKYKNVTTTVKAGDFELSIRGRVLLFDGYTKLMTAPPSKEDKQLLPDFQVGEELLRTDVEKIQRFTKPTSRFSEASLVKELERRGIGRPSTYVPIISTIQERGYVSVSQGRFFAERVGEIVNSRLLENFPDLMQYEFTAKLENELDGIAEGSKDWRGILDQFYGNFSNLMQLAVDTKSGMRSNAAISTSISCPRCNRNMLVHTASSGVFLGCEGFSATENQCRNTVNIRLLSRNVKSTADEVETAKVIRERVRCSKCDLPMEEYLVDSETKLLLCSSSECDGFQVEKGDYSTLDEGSSTSTLECHSCKATMHLTDGRFGKYYKCENPDCNETRRIQKDGSVTPLLAKPLPMPELRCEGIDDHFVLREGRSGLFLAASKYPKTRQTRPVEVRELIPHANELDPKFKHLLDAPSEDPDGNPTTVRYSRKSKRHYIAGKSGSKQWSVTFQDGIWVPSFVDKVTS